MPVFGSWAYDESKLNALQASFSKATPYPHVVIEDFFAYDIAHEIESTFPTDSLEWHVYDNPIEGKLAYDRVDTLDQPVIAMAWKALQSSENVELIRRITSIPELENDPHLHGAGLHYHPRGGRLEMHLDYSIHPITGMERRVNLIIYMNSNWQPEWGGGLQIWEGTPQEPTREAFRMIPRFNTAVLFRTSDVSWHGVPDEIQCPVGIGRKSLAIYFVSPPRPEAAQRFKASFRPRPHVHIEDGYLELCQVRDSRRLEPEDVSKLMPTWSSRMEK